MDSERSGSKPSQSENTVYFRNAATQKNLAPAQKFWKTARIVAASASCLFAVAAGTYLGYLYHNPLFRTLAQGVMSDPFNALIKRDPLVGFTKENHFPEDKRHVINVLLLGCDRDYQERLPEPIKGSKGRSDAILICRVDFDAKQVRVLSIPRDSAVELPRHGIQKINAAHSIGGPDFTIQTIKNVFGLDIDYYCAIHFEGFRKVVDAVGGVELDVEKKLDYDDNWGNLHIHLKPGFQHLTGYEAMGYVRMRHSDSDLMRSKRQQKFLEALRSRVQNPKILLSLDAVLDAITESLNSNMTQEQMLTLANFARAIPRENIQVATLPSLEGRSYVWIKPDDSVKLIREMFYNNDPFAPIFVNAPGREDVARLNGAYEPKRGRRERRGSKETRRAAESSEESGTPAANEAEPASERSSGSEAEAQPVPESQPETSPPSDGGAKEPPAPERTSGADA